ncbi:MAG: hypothetical protein ACPGGK_12995 [Pikeienuella sp.]
MRSLHGRYSLGVEPATIPVAVFGPCEGALPAWHQATLFLEALAGMLATQIAQHIVGDYVLWLTIVDGY